MSGTATLERDVEKLRSRIDTLKSDKAAKLAAAEKLVAAEKEAGRDPLVGASDDDRDSFQRIDAAYKAADEVGEQLADSEARLHRALDLLGQEATDRSGGDPDHPEVVKLRGIAAPVLASPQYAQLQKSGVLNMESARVHMDAVEVLSRDQAKRILRAGSGDMFLADAGDGAELVPIDQQLIPPVPIPVRMPRVLEMITIGQTDSDTVTWTRQTTRTNAAAPTAFGTAAPKSRYEWERNTSNVRRIPHHVVADKGNLADQGQFQTIIEGQGIEDLRLEVEDQVLSGDGTGQNFEGIYEATGIGSQAVGADTKADAAHKAITVVRIALEAEPTAFGIHPSDFQDFWLEKGADGHYVHHSGATDASVRTMWGFPAIVSTGFTSGSPLVGEWRRGATLWLREGIQVAASDNVDDFFLEGLVAILFQTRGAFAVTKPEAFCEITGF